MANEKYLGPYSPATYEAAAQIIDHEARTRNTRGRCIALAKAMHEAGEKWLAENPPPTLKSE